MINATLLLALGVGINVAGSWGYIRDTLQGRTKPNRVTFFLWTLAPAIAVMASLAQGVTGAVVPVLSTALCCLAILLASFCNQRAFWKLGPFDWACGAFSIMAMVLWQTTKEPNVALFFALLADAAAAVPTIRKAWLEPRTETLFSYACGTFSSLTGLLVAKQLAFAEIAFPFYSVLANFGICLILYFRRRQTMGLSAEQE